jgi:hypothetical protein
LRSRVEREMETWARSVSGSKLTVNRKNSNVSRL